MVTVLRNLNPSFIGRLGGPVPAGQIGEVLTATSSGGVSFIVGTWVDAQSLVLTPGIWDLNFSFGNNNGASQSGYECFLGYVPGNNSTGINYSLNALTENYPLNTYTVSHSSPWRQATASTVTIYLKVLALGAGFTGHNSHITAVRVG